MIIFIFVIWLLQFCRSSIACFDYRRLIGSLGLQRFLHFWVLDCKPRPFGFLSAFGQTTAQQKQHSAVATGLVLGVWSCVCHLFYSKEFRASKSDGAKPHAVFWNSESPTAPMLTQTLSKNCQAVLSLVEIFEEGWNFSFTVVCQNRGSPPYADFGNVGGPLLMQISLTCTYISQKLW